MHSSRQSFPAFPRKGVRDHKLNVAKRSIMGADGVVKHEPRSAQIFSSLVTIPSAPPKERDFLFDGAAPLLGKEGNGSHHPKNEMDMRS
jgi:hypothetical protein